jgi:drug/metabolite transporter (DMT)-like permease
VHKTKQIFSNAGWLLLAVVVQTAIGASMVPMRYLQAVAGLPSLALITASDIVAFSIMSWQVLPKIPRKFWRSKTLWLMVSVVLIRTILQTFALRYTKAYIVQLINLLAPFLVVILNQFFIRAPLPRFTIFAITFTIIGGILMVLGGLVNEPMQALLSSDDLIGILLAVLGTLGIAAYMTLVKRSRKIGLPFRIVYISQILSMTVVMSVLSIGLGEDWTLFLTIDWRTILAFLSIAIGVEIGCKLGNIAVLRKLGAPLVSSMLALRLVAALFLGWFVLGERLDSGLQWVGALIVVSTITWYLANQFKSENGNDAIF